MDEFEIQTGTPDSAARGQLLDALLTYNREVTGITEDEELSGFLHDEAGDLIVGVYGWAYGGTGEIALIWVREDHRAAGSAAAFSAPSRRKRSRWAAAKW